MHDRSLFEQLRAAFPAMPLHFAQARTGGTDGGEFSAHVEGKTWEQLDRAYVANRADVLSFLGTRHLVEILPVFLWSLVESGVKTPVPDTLMLVVDRSQKRFDELANALSAAQRAAIVAVLEHFAATEQGPLVDAARAAIERWKRWQPA